MIRRLFWLVLGVALGAWVVLRAKRAVRKWAPSSIAERAAAKGMTVREFARDVRTAMIAKEAELRETLGLNDENLNDQKKNDEKKDGH